MALRQAGLIFRAEAASTLAFTPRAGEGFLVRRIFIVNVSGASVFATFINDTARVGFFRIAGFGGSHLLNPRAQEVSQNVRGTNLLDLMMQQLGFKGYPVVQGETFTINISTGTADIYVLADSYDAGDIKNTDTGGSHTADIMYVNYGTNLNAITATGYNKLDNRQNPAEMVQFPFGPAGSALVPAGKKAHIYVVGGQPVGRFVSGGNTAATNYLRPRIGTVPGQTIFDRNDVGATFFGTTPGSSVDYTSTRSFIPSCPWAIDVTDNVLTQLDFNGNDELQLQVQTVVVGTGQLNAGDIDVWVLQRIFSA